MGISVYSEATIKNQGSYSLKLVADTNSLNRSVFKTLSSPISLANLDKLDFDMCASRTGQNVKVILTNSNAATIEITPDIATADEWQTISTDISDIDNDDKNEIEKIEIKVINADAENTMYYDYMIGDIDSAGGSGGVSKSRIIGGV